MSPKEGTKKVCGNTPEMSPKGLDWESPKSRERVDTMRNNYKRKFRFIGQDRHGQTVSGYLMATTKLEGRLFLINYGISFAKLTRWH